MLTVLEDGGLSVVKVADRKYVGENIVYARVLKTDDRDRVFNMVYEDLKTGRSYAKRFTLGGYTRDRRYELGSSEKTRVFFFEPGDSGVFAHVKLRKKPRIKTDLYVRFDDILVKGRGANGVTLTRHRVSSVKAISEVVYSNRTTTEEDDEQKGLFE